MVNQLIEILGKEATLFESFLALLERQKEMLVNNDLAGLKEVTAQQQQSHIESMRLAEAREELIEQIKHLNTIEGDLTIARLLELVDQDKALQLSRLRDTIIDLNDKIGQTRNANAMLINQSREVISKTMSALAKFNQPAPNYMASGNAQITKSNIMVDRRA